MIDMNYDGLLDEAFLGASVQGMPIMAETGAAEEAVYTDPSPPSSTTSTPGAGASGRVGGGGGGGGGAAASGGRGDNTSTAGTPGGSSTNKLRVRLPASCDPPSPDTPTKPLVWIVFGGTGHMGRSLVKSALAHGDYVTTVGRTHETSIAAMEALAASEAEHGPGDDDTSPVASTSSPLPPVTTPAPGAVAGTSTTPAADKKKMRCLGALCDVRARESVERVVQRTLAHFGRIDVVANCSGYGVVGACEDQDEHELRNQFETNFMGTLHILQATLPIFRRQHELMLHQQQVQQHNQQQQQQGAPQSQQQQQNNYSSNSGSGGRYLIFSSTAGALGVPGLGPYCATKYAVEGLIEAMLYEVDAFNIKATLVEPGLMRRDDQHLEASELPGGGAGTSGGGNGGGMGRSSGNRGDNTNPLPTWGHFLIKPPSETYANPSAPSLHATRMVQWLGDRQPASVVQCAELVWQLAHCSFPPMRLPLGSYAIESIRDRMRSVTEEIEDWKHLNFPLPPDAAAAPAAAAAATTSNTAGAASTTAATATAASASLSGPASSGGSTTTTATSTALGTGSTAIGGGESVSDNKTDVDEEMLDMGV
ncbi:1,2-dihydroxy-3-keto-5-methylthiopentene dioxygenase [Sporothrix stenoceras]